MRHSALLQGSGTTVNVHDPKTGMYMDLNFEPGQTHYPLRVLMNGVTHTVFFRLQRIEVDSEEDIVASLRVPASPSDQPPPRLNVQPHPATVLKPEDRTRAAVEGARANPLPPHPATVQTPNDITRAAREALRDPAARRIQTAERVAAEVKADRLREEPVMSDEELVDLRERVAAQQQKNARATMGALEPLVDSDVDATLLDEYPMSDEEVEALQKDAASHRAQRSAGESGEVNVEFVEEEAGLEEAPVLDVASKTAAPGKKPKKSAVTLR